MRYILITLLFLLSSTSYANGFKNEKEIRVFTDKLMSHILKENFKQAFNSAKLYWPLPEVEIDNMVNQIGIQWSVVNQRFGTAVGTELVKKEKIGSSFLRYYYIHKFEKHALFWKIDLYKPNNEWKINTILFGDDLSSLYE